MNFESVFDVFQDVEPISSEQKEEFCERYDSLDPFQPGVIKPWYNIVDVTSAVTISIAGLSMFWHKNLRTHP